MTAIRRLAAILAADVAGYSRLMGADEEGTHERLKAHFRELFDPKIAEHRGRIVKNTGDELCSRSLRVLWMRLSSLQLAAGNHVMAHRCRERGPSTPSSAPDSALERMGFEPVWGFSCQVVFGLLAVLCSERESRSSSRRLRSGSWSGRKGSRD